MITSVLKTYFIFGLRVIIPLTFIPILALNLGTEGFGVALAAQSLGLVGSLIVQFGFHHTATREVSSCNSAEGMKAIVSNTLVSQIVTSILAVCIVFIMYVSSPSLPFDALAIIGTVLISLGAGLSPAWYYRGTMRAPMISAIELSGQVLGLLLLYSLVKSPTDASAAIFIMGVGPSLTAALSVAMMIKETGLEHKLKFKYAIKNICDSFYIFIMRASSTGITMGAVWYASILMSVQEVAYFAIAAKISTALVSISQPVTQTIMPASVRALNNGKYHLFRFARKWVLALLLMSTICVVLVQISAEPIIMFLFQEESIDAISVTKILAWICMLSAIKDGISDLILIPLKLDKLISSIVVCGAVSFLLLAYLFTQEYGATGMAAARLVSEAVTALFVLVCAIYLKKCRQ